MHLALDKATGDLIKTEGGGVTRVDKGRFVVQQVQSKLSTLLGEWALDTDIGWVNSEDFVRDYDLYDIESRAVDIIVSTQGVLEVLSLDSVVKDRILTITFAASTTYGEINLEVPWGLGG
jgi:hypothetical protein